MDLSQLRRVDLLYSFTVTYYMYGVNHGGHCKHHTRGLVQARSVSTKVKEQEQLE
jgi:hypothetical protein